MKKVKKSRLSDLPIDVAEYMFVEWLVRQGLLSVYKENCEKFRTNHRTFRDDLRSRLRFIRRSPRFAFDDIMAISFPFSMTPEGSDFWMRQSVVWRHFCRDFKSEL